MATPDYTELINNILGWSDEYAGPVYGDVVGMVFGSNPPYTIVDFLSMYPKFFGPFTSVTASITQGSPVVVLSGSPPVIPAGLAAGQLVVDGNFPAGTMIKSISGSSVTLTNAATSTVPAEQLMVYSAPLVPIVAVQLWINLASSCLMTARWFDLWYMAMGWFVAHYCTLYLRSEGNPGTSAAAVASSGLEKGIQVSRGTGPINASAQLVQLADWGAWTETTYGTQLVTHANSIGSGILVVR